MTVVIAAAPLVACADAGDSRCRAVQDVLLSERGPYVLPGPVAEQVDAGLGERVGQHARRGFFEDLARHRFHVERLTARDGAAVELLERDYAELGLGPAEIAIVVVAARLQCTRVVTFDERPFRAITPLWGHAFTVLPADA